MKKLKLISLLCSLVMVLSCFTVFPAFAETATYDSVGGAGTKDNPYLLNNSNFMDFVEKAKANPSQFKSLSFKLTEDIYINNGATDGNASQWASGAVTPTTVLTKPVIDADYAATFDGAGYAISGICMIAGSGVTEVGFIKRLTYDAGSVKNLRLVNSYFEISSNADNSALGSIVAKMYYNATVANCYVDAILTNKAAEGASSSKTNVGVGGIAGALALSRTNFGWYPSITNCVFAGSILNNIGGTGGIIGWVPHSDQDGKETKMLVSDCLNVGSVNSTVSGANVSAIVGGVNWQNVKVTIKNCLNLSTNVPAELLGNGNRQSVSVENYYVVIGLRAKNNFVLPGDTTAWAQGTTLSDFLNNGIHSWSKKAGYIPNPTTHTDIPLSAVLTADALGLKTEGEIHSIRISNTNKGLRFETRVSDAGIALLDELKAAGVTVSMTTYISAGKYFTDAAFGITEFTKEALDQGVEAGSRYLAVPADDFLRRNGDDMGSTFNSFAGSVVGINDLTMKYIAVGCLTLTVGDVSCDVYASWNTDEIASVSDVAIAAAGDTKTEQGVAGYSNLITDLNGNTVYSPYTQAQYDCIKSLIATGG